MLLSFASSDDNRSIPLLKAREISGNCENIGL